MGLIPAQLAPYFKICHLLTQFGASQSNIYACIRLLLTLNPKSLSTLLSKHRDVFYVSMNSFWQTQLNLPDGNFSTTFSSFRCQNFGKTLTPATQVDTSWRVSGSSIMKSASQPTLTDLLLVSQLPSLDRSTSFNLWLEWLSQELMVFTLFNEAMIWRGICLGLSLSWQMNSKLSLVISLGTIDLDLQKPEIKRWKYNFLTSKLPFFASKPRIWAGLKE